MTWLIVLGLAIWVWLQGRQIRALSRRLAALERGAVSPVRTPEPDVAALLLDTPLPDVSNDVDPAPAPAAQTHALTPIEPPSFAPIADDDVLVLTQALPPIDDPAPAPKQPNSRNLERWLAENGLAWLGGGALALGGVMLVAFAAQQSWFTPLVRLYCAVGLGALLLGASEWVRRRPDAHALVASLLAGAGVAAFYATVWGAHTQYGFLDWRGAAALLTLTSLLLMGLAFRHGQALGVLAILAAMLTPALTDMPSWPPVGVTLFVIGVALAAFALAALQRWPWPALAALVGLYLWFGAAIAADEIRRGLALLSIAAIGGVALAFRQTLAANENGQLSWARTRAMAPSIAIAVSCVLMIWVWLAVTPAPTGAVAGPAWVGAMFVALAAAAVRARIAASAIVAVAIGSMALGFVLYLRSRHFFGPIGADFYPFILFAAAAALVSALGARPHHSDRPLVAGAGAIGAALLTALAALSRPEWNGISAWAPLFIGALALLSCAWLSARDAPEPRTDLAVDLWCGAGAVMLLLGVESLLPADIRPAGHASLALTFAAALTWQGWRALRFATLLAATFTLAHAFSSAVTGAALAGDTPLWRTLLVLAIAIGFHLCGAFIIARRTPRTATSEALSTSAIVLALIGVFLSVRWLVAGGTGAQFDALTENALRALALLAAGHVGLPRTHETAGRIGAWRGHALMVAGALVVLTTACVSYNPWWGLTPARVDGAMLFDAIALAFAAPATFLLFAANRLRPTGRIMARAYAAGAALFILLWALLETRRAFHGAQMAIAPVGVFEGGVYGLIVLGAGLIVATVARMRAQKVEPLAAKFLTLMRVAAWAGLAASAPLLLASRHPWWGGHISAQSDDIQTGLAVMTQAAAAVLALFLGRVLSVSRAVEPTRFAAAAAAIIYAWSFGHAAIRWAYHRGAMDGAAAFTDLEGFAHALWPLALVLFGAALTARAPGRDTVRAYLYDLQAIWASAAWPALLFTALGLGLLYNPWWGLFPAQADWWTPSILAIVGAVFAALMSALSPRIPLLRAHHAYDPLARALAVGHLLIGATMLLRALLHYGAIAKLPSADELEMWAFSGLWAVFGAAALGLGAWRNDAVLRWCGLAILLAATLKVFIFDMARLSGVIRVGSALALGVVLMLTALAMRRFGQNAQRDPSRAA